MDGLVVPASNSGLTEAPVAISVDNLRKSYGPRVAVDGLSFTVRSGEIFALLGPNGAGKTTTIEILEGYREWDRGQVTVLGLDPRRDAGRLRPRIGLMLQEGGIYPHVRPGEMLALFAGFYPRPDDPDRLIKLVGLEGSLKTPYRRLSGGQKQRLSLALALIGRPELVFLDEPTAGLDPQARRTTWEILRGLRDRGVTILLTTHYLEEAEQLADRIAIIDHGRLVALGTLDALRGGDRPAVRLVAGPALDPADLGALPSAGAVHRTEPGVYLIECTDPPVLLAEVTAWALRQGVSIREIRVGRESLEEIFLRLTGRALRE